MTAQMNKAQVKLLLVWKMQKEQNQWHRTCDKITSDKNHRFKFPIGVNFNVATGNLGKYKSFKKVN